jgi:glycerol-3-phosphate O-acyltransferase / dihydroxyacetone phosphate acyltransferase
MWLLPLFPRVARIAAAIYYRVRYAGEPVPHAGPALLVANHPNSLLDPMLVVAAARRPVRFLAKAPLFSDRGVGWLVRGAGAIPVYRKVDDPSQMARNEDTFRAVHQALAEGAAVGIFPEGISHSEPSLAPLRTGAARIALGAYPLTGAAFPIVPVGLVLRQKDVFRSEVLVFPGRPVAWEDLAVRGVDDTEAVRELTDRIAESLRQVTLNLERWEDRPLVEFAQRIWELEFEAGRDPAERLQRLDVTTRILAEVRRSEQADALALAGEIESHRRRLARLGLRPADLAADVGLSRGLLWAVRRLHLAIPVALALALAGAAIFWLPYRLTGFLAARAHVPEDVRSSFKLLVGALFYLVWTIVLVTVAWLVGGAWTGLAVLILVPSVGLSAQYIRERWHAAWNDMRRFVLLRSRRELVRSLRARQRELAIRVNALYKDFAERGLVA